MTEVLDVRCYDLTILAAVKCLPLYCCVLKSLQNSFITEVTEGPRVVKVFMF